MGPLAIANHLSLFGGNPAELIATVKKVGQLVPDHLKQVRQSLNSSWPSSDPIKPANAAQPTQMQGTQRVELMSSQVNAPLFEDEKHLSTHRRYANLQFGVEAMVSMEIGAGAGAFVAISTGNPYAAIGAGLLTALSSYAVLTYPEIWKAGRPSLQSHGAIVNPADMANGYFSKAKANKPA